MSPPVIRDMLRETVWTMQALVGGNAGFTCPVDGFASHPIVMVMGSGQYAATEPFTAFRTTNRNQPFKHLLDNANRYRQ